MDSFRIAHFVALFLAAILTSDCLAQREGVTATQLNEARENALRNPRSVSAQIELGELSLQANVDNEALRAAATALSLDRLNSKARSLHAKALLRLARYEEGLKQFADLPEGDRDRYQLKSSVEAAKLAQEAEKLLATASQTESLADDREAIVLLQRAVRESPDLTLIQKTLGFLLLDKLREPQNAYPYLSTVVQRSPNDVDGRKLLAQAALQIGRFPEARQLYERLTRDEAENTDLQIAYARALIGSGKRAEGLALLQKLLGREPENDLVRKALAGIDQLKRPEHDLKSPAAIALFEQASVRLRDAARSNQRADYQAAGQLLEQALILEPTNFELRKSLGYLYLEKLYSPHQAYQHLSQARQIRPDDLDALKLMGVAALNIGVHCEAIELLEQARERDPDDLWVRVNLGRAYARGEAYQVALGYYNGVLANDPSNFMARLGIAEVRGWQGFSHEPITIVESLLNEQPQSVDANVLAGDLYRWNYDLNTASYHYETALGQDPGNQGANTGLYEIDKTLSFVAYGDGYQFRDNFGFNRQFESVALRIPTTNQAFLTPRWTEWQYDQGATSLSRSDAIIDLEYNFNRHWQLTARFLNFDYSHVNSQQAGSVSLKYSPRTAIDLYLSASANEPAYLTDIGIPLFNIRMNNFGLGFDLDLFGEWSTQGTFNYSDYSDSNERRYGMAQLSYKLLPCEKVFLRLQYEDLSFKDQTPIYFSPGNFEIVRLIFDVDYPLTERLDILAKIEGLEVLGEGSGYMFKVGPRLTVADRLELRASYFDMLIPGAASYSGRGFDVFGSYWF